jgi:hypothetical protein
VQHTPPGWLLGLGGTASPHHPGLSWRRKQPAHRRRRRGDALGQRRCLCAASRLAAAHLLQNGPRRTDPRWRQRVRRDHHCERTGRHSKRGASTSGVSGEGVVKGRAPASSSCLL